jgi:hypothetical protein
MANTYDINLVAPRARKISTAAVDSATAAMRLGQEITVLKSVWRLARRYPKTTVWVGGAAAIAYVLLRRTSRGLRTH